MSHLFLLSSHVKIVIYNVSAQKLSQKNKQKKTIENELMGYDTPQFGIIKNLG